MQNLSEQLNQWMTYAQSLQQPAYEGAEVQQTSDTMHQGADSVQHSLSAEGQQQPMEQGTGEADAGTEAPPEVSAEPEQENFDEIDF